MEALLPPHVLHGDDDCNQQAGKAVLDGASAAAAALPAADCAACSDGAAHGEAAQFFSPGAELASHLVRHNWCITTRRSTRFMLHVCSPSLWLCCEVSSVHSGAVPSHAMDPASAFTFHGAVGDGRALFGSMRGERPQANKAHLSSVPSPWALPGGGSDACAHSSSAAPAGTANLHAIGRLLDPCVCALLRHVGSVLIEIGSAPRGGSSGDDDERGEMGGVSGVGNSAVERG